MNLLPRLKAAFGRQAGSAIPAEGIALDSLPASGLSELSERLSRWGKLWTPGKEAPDAAHAQDVITKRLTRWMVQCFGEHMPSSLNQAGDPISLASSMPVLTAFLGRRATRELSRRVLQDL